MDAPDEACVNMLRGSRGALEACISSLRDSRGASPLPRSRDISPRRQPAMALDVAEAAVLCLEGDLQASQGDVTLWRERCLESQRERAIAAARAESAEQEIQSLRTRERHLEDSLAAAARRNVEREELLRCAEQRARAFETRAANLQDSLLLAEAGYAEECRLRKESCEASAAVASKHAEDMQLLRIEHREKSTSMDKHSSLLARRVAELEDKLSVISSRHMEELLKERTSMANVAHEADKRADFLERSLRIRENDFIAEISSLRAKVEHLDEANRKLRSDVRFAVDQAARDSGISAIKPPSLSLPERAARPIESLPPRKPSRPASARFHREPLAPLSGPDHMRTPRSRLLRGDTYSAFTPDRTAAFDRYNAHGRLVSFDAAGRAV